MRAKIIIILLFLIMLALAIIRVQLISVLFSDGVELLTVQKHIKQVQRENTLLKEQVLEKRAYTRISEEAAKRGFTTQAVWSVW